MKPVRNILILLLIIAVLGGSYYVISHYEPENDTVDLPELSTAITVFETEKNSITTIKITDAEETYVLTKSGANWMANGDKNIKLDQACVSTFLYECACITAKDVIEENAQDLAVYGLNEAARSVEIQTNDGRTTKILIGTQSIEGSVCYLMLAEESTVYAKDSMECNRLVASLASLMNSTVYRFNEDDITGICLKQKGTDEMNLRLVNTAPSNEDPAYVWMMETPIEKDVDHYIITKELLPAIATLTAVDIIPIPEKGKDYGFTHPSAEYSVWNSNKEKAYTVLVGKTNGEKTFVKLKNEQTVYTVKKEALNFLSLNFKDLADALIYTENLSEISKIEMQGLGKQYTAYVQKNGENYAYNLNGKNIEENKFRTLYQAMIGLMFDSYTKEPTSTTSVFTIRFTKTDGSQTVVSCINHDERNYLVKVNGKGNFLVRKKQIDSMIEQLDKTLKEA